MRHGNGTAVGDLFLKERNDTAVAAEDVAETDGYKARIRGAAVHALDDHLADALRCAHDIRGIHGFIR